MIDPGEVNDQRPPGGSCSKWAYPYPEESRVMRRVLHKHPHGVRVRGLDTSDSGTSASQARFRSLKGLATLTSICIQHSHYVERNLAAIGRPLNTTNGRHIVYFGGNWHNLRAAPSIHDGAATLLRTTDNFVVRMPRDGPSRPDDMSGAIVKVNPSLA